MKAALNSANHQSRVTSQPQPDAAAQSLQVFGLYLCATGLALLLAPALVLAPLQLPLPTDAWIRLVGVLALALGSSDVLAARTGLQPLVRWSVWRRLGASAVMLALVAAAVAPPAVLLFAALDAAAAGWTALALRRSVSAPLLHT